ncbi:protein kinase [Frankia sp. CNm7]|uniref:non-specific serine/threonine protein kinase n=1 Tax=Frankia nepalensis TaxID=1836974 RepID=A0A937RCP3_9ACTN|nr:serine/threonine-protein kinase [Frankia nepalensis]MBL7495856.1 protein kinase [Frankia nepalensis]MBL7509932.1 protein kinase [Frankia nepalensis]MBL7521900.1 protein kinase [Frankia nepalensis]MBL7629691.1 protein kinase [Frankia nepalensis]
MTVIRCPENDGGTIEDGYCDVCGLAYVPPAVPAQAAVPAGPSAPAPARVPAPAPASARRGPNGCADPECGGHVVDGYCDTCGLSATASLAPAAPAAPGGSTAGSSGSSGGGRTGRRSRPTRTRLGEGLVQVPEMPAPDPTTMLMVDPAVPEGHRYCPNPTCRQPVGRSRGDRPGRVTGFCGVCRTSFDFTPPLKAGDEAGAYEIVGALAHGGQGWVYLAKDSKVEKRRVVLKGILDSEDADNRAAAIAERRFLAAVDHSSIVKIFAFVEHAGAGYIVMEYVGGTSLRELLKRRRDGNAGRPSPLPVAQAISYILAVLPAFSYLHRNRLVFCDFKPDNVMLSGDSLKLIDLGAVRHLDAEGGAIYGTPGYQAPEVAREGPSVASDLYTIGRTLLALILNFRGNITKYRYSLPPVAEHPVLEQYDSLYRFLRKSTAPKPDDRFASADEMRDELLGVLREIAADQTGEPKPAPSRVFGGDNHLTGENPDGTRAGPAWAVLPTLRVDPEDAAASTLKALPDTDPDTLAQFLTAISPATVEVRLRLARARMESGDEAAARALLAELEAEDPWEWRVEYYQGLLALAADNAAAARVAFDSVYSQAPGELAPKLALGLAAEAGGDLAYAAKLYDIVSRTDDGFTSAAFGLARVRLAAGDRAGAASAYERVPRTSAAYVDAQMRLARVLGTRTAAGEPSRDDLAQASRVLGRLDLDPGRRAALSRDLLDAALAMVTSGAVTPGEDVTVVGAPLRETPLRFRLEGVYRELAKQAGGNRAERYRLVDLANGVRPRTWF